MRGKDQQIGAFYASVRSRYDSMAFFSCGIIISSALSVGIAHETPASPTETADNHSRLASERVFSLWYLIARLSQKNSATMA